MKIEVGKIYKTRDNLTVKIDRIDETAIHGFYNGNDFTYEWDLNGRYAGEIDNIWDLMCECDEEGNELAEIVVTVDPDHKPDPFDIGDIGEPTLEDLAGGAPEETISGLTFGQAISLLKSGAKVTREGWNGKGQYLELQVPDEHSKMRHPYIYISPVDGKFVPWLASQTDMLAEDWMVYS